MPGFVFFFPSSIYYYYYFFFVVIVGGKFGIDREVGVLGRLIFLFSHVIAVSLTHIR